jgi:hypothetical protein
MALLTRELGPSDAARFVAQFSGGTGDYTVDRVEMFADKSVAELAAEIRKAVAAKKIPSSDS